MKLFKIAALALCLNVPMAHAINEELCAANTGLTMGISFCTGYAMSHVYEGYKAGKMTTQKLKETAVLAIPVAISLGLSMLATNVVCSSVSSNQ